MKYVLIVKKFCIYKNYLTDDAGKVKPLRNEKESGIYHFTRNDRRDNLYILEIGKHTELKAYYENQYLKLTQPDFQNYKIPLGPDPCLIVVHHWGRGVSFELNDGTPPLKPLQVGLKGKWEIISCQPCIAVTSGGTDPISDLIECFFKPDEEISGNFLKIEDRLNNECAAQEEDLK